MSAIPKILIVDDEPRMCVSLGIMLDSEGYETKWSSSGEEAIRCLSENEFDLILLDVVMPGMDGYAVLDHVRRMHPDTLVVMMTGRATIQSAVEALKKGAHDYLSKPIEHEELLRRIGNAVAQRRLKTEKSKLETQLNEVQKLELMNVLASGLAHDFNNLLTVIQGNVSLMLMETDPAHPQYRRLLNIEQQVENGAKIIEKLMGYIRKEQRHADISDVNSQIGELVNVFCRARKEIRIYQDLQSGLPCVKMDKGKIEQVLLNLLINAADAMPQGGEITLSTRKIHYDAIPIGGVKPGHPDYVLITLTDTGEGMNPEIMKHIFDPFFTTKPPGKGTGLGLTSVYSIIRETGGYIEVESAQGKGTTFYLYLPASILQAAPVVDKKLVSNGKNRGNILLVDDEEMIIETGRALLKSMGYKVYEARKGERALQIYKKHGNDIDVVLLDLIMPGMRGEEVYGELVKMNPRAKVVIISGYADERTVQDVLRRGCSGFLQKPFNIQELSRVLDETMGGARAAVH